MENVSFGNRWFRGMYRNISESQERWEFRKWSLDDDRPYQPYSRAHGLFRRVASWTVANMQNHRRRWSQSSSDARVLPEELPSGMLPYTATTVFWKDRPPVEKVCWARFDLKLAFPSVRMDVLRERVMGLISGVVGDDDPSGTSVETNLLTFSLDGDLELYGDKVRQVLMDKEQVKLLADYFLRAMESVTYFPYDQSDEHCFGSSDDPANPPILPMGDGENHPGLPTGLCASPLLLNAYLHPIDFNMVSWFRENRGGAYYRFADDIILLADSPVRLAESIELLSKSVLSASGRDEGSNLRINWEKVKPEPLGKVLGRTGVALPGKPLRGLSENKDVLLAISASAVTKSQNPFITDLVECLSDLGTEHEADALPENALSRVARLREIVFLRPDDEAVPRPTQLLFAANHLTRTWLPELGPAQDRATIESIREAVSEAIRGAPDKPRLWRSIVRASVRRSFPGGHAIEEGKAAAVWLEELASNYSLHSKGEWLLDADAISAGRKVDREKWYNFAIFHRASLWRAISEVSQDMWTGVRRLDAHQEMATPESWLFRAFDEIGLRKTAEWLEAETAKLTKKLYGKKIDPLNRWEASPFAVAMMSFVPSTIVTEHFSRRPPDREEPFYKTVAALLRQLGNRWSRAVEALSERPIHHQRPATLPRLLTLCRRVKDDDEAVAQALLERNYSLPVLLRFADEFKVQRFLSDRRDEIYKDIIAPHESRLVKVRAMGPWSIARELQRYERGRRIWIGLM